MPVRPSPSLLPVVRRLLADARLTEPEISAVAMIRDHPTSVRQGAQIGEERQAKPRFLLRGWVAHVRHLPDGRRQIVQLSVPGDLLPTFEKGAAEALTDCIVADASPLWTRAARGEAPGLMKAWRISKARDGARLADAIVRLGQMSAYERTVDLFEELQRRLDICDPGHPESYRVPLTQQMLSEALGLSAVHVNRVLQRLRREDRLEFRSGVLRVGASASLRGRNSVVAA